VRQRAAHAETDEADRIRELEKGRAELSAQLRSVRSTWRDEERQVESAEAKAEERIKRLELEEANCLSKARHRTASLRVALDEECEAEVAEKQRAGELEDAHAELLAQMGREELVWARRLAKVRISEEEEGRRCACLNEESLATRGKVSKLQYEVAQARFARQELMEESEHQAQQLEEGRAKSHSGSPGGQVLAPIVATPHAKPLLRTKGTKRKPD